MNEGPLNLELVARNTVYTKNGANNVFQMREIVYILQIHREVRTLSNSLKTAVLRIQRQLNYGCIQVYAGWVLDADTSILSATHITGISRPLPVSRVRSDETSRENQAVSHRTEDLNRLHRAQ